MKKLVILSLAVSLLTGGYAIETLGAAEQGVVVPANSGGQSPVVQLNARQMDLVLIGKYTATGDEDALREAIREAVASGNLTAKEVSVAIRQLYSAAGLKKTNNALGLFDRMSAESDFGIDYNKLNEQRLQGLNEALGKSSNESTTEASKGIKYNNFPKKRPKPYNRDRAKMGNLDREIIITAALAANVGANSIYEQHRNKLIELGLTPEQINMLESIAY